MKKLILSASILAFGIFNAQEATETAAPKVTFSGYAEIKSGCSNRLIQNPAFNKKISVS